MSEYRIASRYATAFLELASEQQKLDRVYQDAKAFLAVCADSRDLTRMLKNPIIKSDKKQGILKRLFGDSYHDLTLRFTAIVSRKGREDLLTDIFETFVEQYNKRFNITKATVYTAQALSQGAADKIKSAFEKQFDSTFELSTEVDPELIGGFVFRFDDKLINAGVASQLKRLEKDLTDWHSAAPATEA